MLNKFHQRNLEWFESTFTKKLQIIIQENKEDSLSWVRDSFISLLLAILPIALQALDDVDNSGVIIYIINYGTAISLFGLCVWFLICILRYNKKIKKLKSRLLAHSIKNSYSLEECVQLFDTNICNELLLAKNYIELAESSTDTFLKEFYLIESLHYYFKSIREFNIICASSSLSDLFSDISGSEKKINIFRLQNYLELVKSIKIKTGELDSSTLEHIKMYDDSYSVVKEAFTQTLSSLKTEYKNTKRIIDIKTNDVDIIE